MKKKWVLEQNRDIQDAMSDCLSVFWSVGRPIGRLVYLSVWVRLSANQQNWMHKIDLFSCDT